MKKLLGVLFVVLLLRPLDVMAADSCVAGYWVNDVGECEICPGGYFCYDGIYKSECPGGGLSEAADAIWLTGVTGVLGCGFSYVPPGYYLKSSDGASIVSVECNPGSFCPGIDYVVRVSDLRNGGLGGSAGLVSCGLAYSMAGADSADDCVPCPEYIDRDYHKAGFMMPEASDSVESCAFVLLFGSQELLDSLVLFYNSLLGDGAVSTLSSYQAGHLNNTRGVYALGFRWDAVKNKYVVDGERLQPFGCGAGFFAPMASEQLPPDFSMPESEELSVDQAINLLCAPVGKNAYSPGYSFDDDYDGFAWYACPDGTYSAGYGIGADDESDCCVAGYRSYNGVCNQMCMGGVSYLKTSTGMSVPLFAQPLTVPGLKIKYNDVVCHVPVASGVKKGVINFNYNGAIYHVAE